jgi:hypothetical protein
VEFGAEDVTWTRQDESQRKWKGDSGALGRRLTSHGEYHKKRSASGVGAGANFMLGL